MYIPKSSTVDIKHSRQAGNLIAEVEAANIKRGLGNLHLQRGGRYIQSNRLSTLLTGMMRAQNARDC